MGDESKERGAEVADRTTEETAANESSRGKERRRSRRFPCEGQAEAVVLQPEFLFRGEITNVSLTGCFIRTRARLQVELHSIVDLRFRLKNQQCHTYALVMDIRPGLGVGVEFYSENKQPQEWIQELILKFNEDEPSKKA
jgi:hypothetical protein